MDVSSLKCFGLQRVGSDRQLVVSGTFEQFKSGAVVLAEPLTCVVICASMHDIEEKMYEHFLYDGEYTQGRLKEVQ